MSLSLGKGGRLDCKNEWLMTGAMMGRQHNTLAKEESTYVRKGQPMCHQQLAYEG